MYQIHSNVTFGVNSTGNIKALLLCLFSVLNGETLPAAIQLRMEGEFPAFDDFYLAQVSEIARIKGVEFSVNVAKSKGVRFARDWQIQACSTPILWSGDDDVVYDYECLSAFTHALPGIHRSPWGYLCGSKLDVNNRRGYKDFSSSTRPASEVKDGCSFNHFYERGGPRVVKVKTLDTGNALLNLELIRKQGVRFQLYPDSANSGGEDTLFALQCEKQNLTGLYAPDARAFHLEKQQSHFSEFAARGEMLLRVAEKEGLNKSAVKEEIFPWLWKH